MIQQTSSDMPSRYLYGGSTIHPQLQAQMLGMSIGEKKEMLLDDQTGNYRFEIIIDHLRQATDAEIMLGYPVDAGGDCDPYCACYIRTI